MSIAFRGERGCKEACNDARKSRLILRGAPPPSSCSLELFVVLRLVPSGSLDGGRVPLFWLLELDNEADFLLMSFSVTSLLCKNLSHPKNPGTQPRWSLALIE
ncbi:unnamed protein product [Musa acuminata subsp. burmannicoides]